MTDGKTRIDRENEAIKAAASEITDLWWAKPNENGHIKTQVVELIIRKHLQSLSAREGELLQELFRREGADPEYNDLIDALDDMLQTMKAMKKKGQ